MCVREKGGRREGERDTEGESERRKEGERKKDIKRERDEGRDGGRGGREADSGGGVEGMHVVSVLRLTESTRLEMSAWFEKYLRSVWSEGGGEREREGGGRLLVAVAKETLL